MHSAVRAGPVTVRVTTLKGVDAGAYYVEALPSYYLDRSEPPGRWRGDGAITLGLGETVDDGAFLNVMAGTDPNGSFLLGRRYGEQSVRGFDATASAPKSVSVLWALGSEPVRRAAVDAHDAAVDAMVGWIETHAHTRLRLGGEVAVVDADGIAAACFRQHTSRALDPQLHTHVVIPNRVLGPDGRWLALDARTIKVDQRTLSAVYHAALRAELTRTLGVTWRDPVNGIAEITGVDDHVLAEFSSRTDAVRRRVGDKVERFIDAFAREPTARERWRLEREAVADSRPPKAHDVDAASLHASWRAQARDAGIDAERVVASVLGRAEVRSLDDMEPAAVGMRALEKLAERQSSWRPAEVVRELAAAVPTDLGAEAADVVAWLDGLADGLTAERLLDLSRPVPAGAVLRRDGRPVTESALDRALTTAAILDEEERLFGWAERRLDSQAGGGLVAMPAHLTGPQRELARAVAGRQLLVLAVGPAGTGKTTALRPGVAAIRASGRTVFGVTPSAAAAQVLGAEAGVDTDTVDKLLVEHRPEHRPDARFDLQAGATLLVDEASMLPTAKLAELAALADRRSWRVVLVGDPLQFSAVGRGGFFAHLVEAFGAIELDRVHRFTNDWERAASLRLRRGDASVADLYDRHGRLHGGTEAQMASEIIQAWWRTRTSGATVALMAATNDAVTELNQRAQALRARAGEIDLDGPAVNAGGYDIVVGDRVATRRNERQLRTDQGHMIRNRDQWTVTAVAPDGSIAVNGATGTVRLPAEYVITHVELAYAQTAHAAQGRTVDHSLVLIDGPVDGRAVYVPLSRGRHGNHAYVVTDGDHDAADLLAQALARDWVDQPAIARRAELHHTEPRREHRTAAELGPRALRHLLERQYALDQELARRRVDHDTSVGALQRARHRQKNLEQAIVEAHQRIAWQRERITDLDRPLRRRRHRDELDSARRVIAQAERTIADSQTELATLDERLPELLGRTLETGRRAKDTAALEEERTAIAERLIADRSARANRLAADPPELLVRELGQRPSGAAAARAWDDAAGRISQHRTAHGITDPDHLLGPQPRWGDEPALTSYQVARQAIEQHERHLERSIGARSLGLGR